MLGSVNALKDIGSRKPTSKLMLWSQWMNVLQDYESDIRNLNTDRKSRFGQLMRTSNFFFVNHVGEFQIQMRSSLALADSIKLKDSKGKIVTFWDAF